ncbi:UNVERIFIED_CONTAM: hypothetical protein RMT77_013182 [Armadillidium vulgare]
MGGERNGVSSVNKNKTKSFSSTWHKAITRNSKWPDKDEFLDVIYWTRQVIGIILGLIWGCIPLVGIIGLILFCAINALVIYVYTSSYQGVDEEEFGGLWEITKEGFVTSFAGFLVMWIIVYSGLHFD